MSVLTSLKIYVVFTIYNLENYQINHTKCLSCFNDVDFRNSHFLLMKNKNGVQYCWTSTKWKLRSWKENWLKKRLTLREELSETGRQNLLTRSWHLKWNITRSADSRCESFKTWILYCQKKIIVTWVYTNFLPQWLINYSAGCPHMNTIN